MGLFKNKHDYAPLALPDNPKVERIVQTIEAANLDPEQVMLVGSAAITLYDIDLSWRNEQGEYEERPGDVDFSIALDYLYQIDHDGHPDGLPIAAKANNDKLSQNVLQVHTPFLPVDLITMHSTEKSKERRKVLGDRFRASLQQHSRPIDGVNVRVATPQKLYRTLHHKQNALEFSDFSMTDPKDITDYRRFLEKFPTTKSRHVPRGQ